MTVYIAEARGQYKIGRSKNPAARVLRVGQTHIYMHLHRGEYPVIVHTMPADAAHRVEKALHWLFRHKQVYGEWFALDPQDLAWIAEQTEASILHAADAEWYRILKTPRPWYKDRAHKTWRPTRQDDVE